MRVQDNADRVGVVVEVLERQVRVVGHDGADPDEYRVVPAPEPLGPGLVLVGRDGDLAPLGPGDLPVGGHGAVDVDEGPQEPAPGATVKR